MTKKSQQWTFVPKELGSSHITATSGKTDCKQINKLVCLSKILVSMLEKTHKACNEHQGLNPIPNCWTNGQGEGKRKEFLLSHSIPAKGGFCLTAEK